MEINLQNLIDDARCYEAVRDLRWPEKTSCPHCSSDNVIRRGKDDAEIYKQRYECKQCYKRFDDLTNTVFAGHHQPLKTWIIFLYFLGLNLSTGQIAKELGLDKDDAHYMASVLRSKVVDKKPDVKLFGALLHVLKQECDTGYVIYGAGSNAPLSENALSRAISRIQERVGIPHWTAHDLRRTFATQLGETLRIDPVVIEKCLGHKMPRIMATYNRNEMLPERKEALNKWGEYIAYKGQEFTIEWYYNSNGKSSALQRKK